VSNFQIYVGKSQNVEEEEQRALRDSTLAHGMVVDLLVMKTKGTLLLWIIISPRLVFSRNYWVGVFMPLEPCVPIE
jgi:hypothetical protein